MFTALSSLLLNQAIDKEIAMTGEVSLRGAVLPVGGIKEKVIAAHRSGVKRIILSKQNESDLVDVPEEVRREMRFDLVEDINDLLGILFNRRQHLLTSMSPEIAACN
jgi:ATP-dependent Lon protease